MTTHLLGSAEQSAQCKSPARQPLPAVLELLDMALLHFYLLLCELDRDVLAFVRLDNRAHVGRLEDRDSCRGEQVSISVEETNKGRC